MVTMDFYRVCLRKMKHLSFQSNAVVFIARSHKQKASYNTKVLPVYENVLVHSRKVNINRKLICAFLTETYSTF